MTARRRRHAIAGLTVLFAMISACGGGGGGEQPAPPTPPPPPAPPSCTVTSVTVSAAPSTITVGTTTSLNATVNASANCSTGVTWTASPAGGTLTPSGATATFASNTAGTFTLTATSTADTTKAGQFVVSVMPAPCATPNGVSVTHATDVAANETWAGDGVTHRVPNTISLTGTAAVTIQPCAIVALGSGASIAVRDSARLIAAGTNDARFVLFKRADENSPWGVLRNFASTSFIDLSYTTLRGGGNSGTSNNATIVMTGEGYGSLPRPVVKVDHVVIESSQGAGILIDTNAAFSDDSRELRIVGASGNPVRMTMMSLGSLPTGSFSGNASDEILIVGPNQNVFADMTIHDRGVPIRIQTSGLTVASSLSGGPPVTLTIEPGVVMKFPKASATTPGARVKFGGNGNSPNNLVGVLNAIGTAEKPIVFTSGEAVPAAGDWQGLWLDTANGSHLDHVEISYAGAPNGIVSNNCKPTNTTDHAALVVGDFEPQYVPPANLITNSMIRHSAGHAINAVWQTSTHNQPNLTASNVFEGITYCRQTYNAVSSPGSCPTTLGCTAP